MAASFAVILPAAGRSSRFQGKEKKPFATLDGRAIWLRSAELFVNRPEVKQVLAVIAPDDEAHFRQRFGANLLFLNIQVVRGGAERFESVANALAQLAPEVDFVAVHDAVRPCAPPKLIDSVFRAAEEHGAALPCVPVADTVKRVSADMRVEATLPRAGLWLAQTPQVFRRQWLEEAYARRHELSGGITDDAQLVESLGRPVYVVPGAAENLKITTADDVALADRFLQSRKQEPVKPRGPFEDDLYR